MNQLYFQNIIGTIDVYMDCLRAICGDTEGKSMIDLMCAFAPNTPKLGFERREYVDVIDRKLDHIDEQKNFINRDVFGYLYDLTFKADIAICSDGIEHLHRFKAMHFIDEMCRVSRKQIIFTPLGEIFPLHNTGPDDPEAHHSLWTPEDFPGWNIIVFPDYHKEWNGGAFFTWRCDDSNADFIRVKEIIETKPWAKIS